MARTDNLTNFLNDVATAIKSKLDDSTAIPASQFDTKIMSIQTRGNYETRTVNVTSNGSQTITPNQGYDAIESIVINTQVPIPQLQTKSYEFTDNATITLSPETGYDGFSSISLTIAVPGGSINNQNKTITQNGSYTADQGYTGIGTATVNVPIVNTSEYSSDLLLSQQILGSSALPYTPLEYIESTGTQYIDTAYSPTVNTYFDVTACITQQNNSDKVLLGSRVGNNRFWIDFDDTGEPPSILLGYGSYVGIQSYTLNTLYQISLDINTRKIKINNVETDINLNYDATDSLPIYIFRANYTPNFYGCFKLYNCKLYDNNVLIRDFIPVKRKSDNEICLYDRVSCQFFTNQGTGSFIAGPVIN